MNIVVIILAILILLLAAALIFIILIQESKGGGLVSTIGGVNKAAEFFGVRRATEDVEKITWYIASAIAILSFVMNVWLSSGGTTAKKQNDLLLQKGLKSAPITNPTAIPQAPQAPKK